MRDVLLDRPVLRREPTGSDLRVQPGTAQPGRRGATCDVFDRWWRHSRPVRRSLDRRAVGIERQARATGGLDFGQGAVDLGAPAIPAERLDEELHPVALPVLAVAQPVKHAQDRLGDVQDFAGRQEREQDLARPAVDRGAAAGGDAEAALDHLAVASGFSRTSSRVPRADRGAPAEIVNRGRDVILGAAFEGDLELARERRAERMPQQEARERLGIRRHIERLVTGDAGVRAGGDVAHRVAARFPRRQASLGERAHRRLDLVQPDEMKLHVLASGDVAEAAGVRLSGFRQRKELFRGSDALRDLDAQHLRVAGLTLSVGAPDQPERAPLVGRQLSALESLERGHELVDFRLARERQPRSAESLGIVDSRHKGLQTGHEPPSWWRTEPHA